MVGYWSKGEVKMVRTVCIYKGKLYGSVRKFEEDKVVITSTSEKNWDVCNVDIAGNLKRNPSYVKVVRMEELDAYFKLKYTVVYKGHPFVPMSMSKNVLKRKKIYIVTRQKELVDVLGLEPSDRMEYGRLVSPEDIDYVIVEKTYLVGEDKGKIEISNVNLIEYISSFPLLN